MREKKEQLLRQKYWRYRKCMFSKGVNCNFFRNLPNKRNFIGLNTFFKPNTHAKINH